jgi:Trk-type K+ transport system membrane component
MRIILVLFILLISSVVTAFDTAGLESGYSNEVELIIDNRTISKAPKTPTNLKIRKPNL